MAKNKEEKLDILRNIQQETEIHTLLEELLPEMGFQHVYVTHERGNKSEDGKDVICSKHDDIENTDEWYAFVVKKGAISGQAGVVQNIMAQVQECFEYEYNNSIKKLRFHVNKVRIVSNEHFSNEAERKIRENTKYEKANIAFWDNEHLIKYIDKYYPQYWTRGSKVYKKYVESFSNIIDVENFAKSIGVNDKKIRKILDCAIEPHIKERITNEDDTFTWKNKSTNSIIQLESNTIIVGEPGSGKSTLLKKLSKEVIEQNSLRNDCEFYPILLSFNDLNQNSFDVEETINEYFRRDWNRDLHIDGKQVLESANCVVFIDALDELPNNEKKSDALKAIDRFHKQYDAIKIICTSRPSDYLFQNSGELGYRYMEMCPIDKRQIESFLSNYFADNIVKSQRLLRSLKDSGILEKLPKTPMTIALITILFDEKEVEIPATITDLYQQFVDLLLGRNTSENTMELIEVGIKHRLLCYIARYLHAHHELSISRIDMIKLVYDYAKERGQSPNTDAIIEDLIENTGLLFKNSDGQIQFKHLSFQEYFTAYEFFYRQLDRETLVVNFNNMWWQNVSIFYAGMSKDSPELLQDILCKAIPNDINSYITNTIGMGHILQALYNTPIIKRIECTKQGLSNIEKAIQTVIADNNAQNIFRTFSKYGLMQLFGSLFTFSYWSITLVEPLKQLFQDMIVDIEAPRSEQEQFYYEFKLYLICSILASDDFICFSEYRTLIDLSRSKDLSLVAIIDTHRRMLDKMLSNNAKEDVDYQKLSKKMQDRMRHLGRIGHLVNTPIGYNAGNTLEVEDK